VPCQARHPGKSNAVGGQQDLLQTVPLDVDGRALKGEFLRSANIESRYGASV